MLRILLIHMNASEGTERAKLLRAAGYDVTRLLPQGLKFLRDVRRDPPDAIVIDLERLPSVGRDIGLALRISKATRQVPIIFAGGVAEKIAGLRTLLPDAEYAPWAKIGGVVKRAIVRGVEDPVVPRSIFETYTSTPILKKLGVKENSSLSLVDAPDGFGESLGRLPEGVTIGEKFRRGADLTMWFVRSRMELERGIKNVAADLDDGSIWIAWPKKTSAIVSDLSQVSIRSVGLASGLVDFKVCAIDATWSGLLFRRRKPARAEKMKSGRHPETSPA
jgi:CheY-like chemotaxis protein